MPLIKPLFRWLLTALYKVKVTGLEHFTEAGERVLVVANHTSFIDALLLWAFLPGKLTFAVNTHIARRRRFRPFLALVQIFPMDPTNPLSAKSLIQYLRRDRKAVIFPEGRITVTGALMKVYDGTGMVADRSGAMVLPIRIEGAQYTPFSRLRGRVRLRWFPRISLTVLPPRRISPHTEVTGRARRRFAGKLLSDIMTEMMFETSNYHRTVFSALLDARRIHGGRHIVVEDIERKPVHYNKLVAGAFVLGDALSRQTHHGEYVGILLPSTATAVMVFMGLQTQGRVPAMLNYTVGARGMLSACHTARLRTVLTSRRFVQAAKLEHAAETLSESVKIVYLEDLVRNASPVDKLRGWLAARLPDLAYGRRCPKCNAEDAAVVLFTSGSEGAPKGVVLSHANLLANRAQLAARVDFGSQDVIFNALPLFHSFGLTAGTLLPLLSGMRTFFYPSPLHYRIVPEMVYDVNATILFGTNTFLAGYARFAHPYDFYSVRYVFAGAEKLQEDTRRIWAERFGVRIFEGYGATETSPILAANTPMENARDTVGRFLPGIEYYLEPVPGVDQGGRLHVRGPNVMLGYLLPDEPGECIPPRTTRGEGWYDTGDIVIVDDDGFVHIRGRAKRFAKVGGEMVSLTAVEELAARTWPEKLHAAVSVPDPQKGEQLILVTEQPTALRGPLLARASSEGIGEINVPKKIIRAKTIPLLGTGKTDYTAVQALVAKELGL
jgi:acyl-[acyl-carrier-protein]-phospholipid O-acyltransferase/long-chain-fatty-acid--[acyl-carrier-protein] ligase